MGGPWPPFIDPVEGLLNNKDYILDTIPNRHTQGLLLLTVAKNL